MREQAGRCGLGEHWPPLRLPPETVVSADPDERRRSARGGPSACMHTHWKLAGTAGRATSPPCLFACTSERAARPDVPCRPCASARPPVGTRAGRQQSPLTRDVVLVHGAAALLARACMHALDPPVVSPCRTPATAIEHARTHARVYLPACGAACPCGRWGLRLRPAHRPSKASHRPWMDRWGRATAGSRPCRASS